MKKRVLTILIAALVLFSGCGNKVNSDRRILVSVFETENVSAENNGQWIYPGQNARFTLNITPGFAVTGTDYPGTARIWKENGKILLEVENVDYPTRVGVFAVSMYRTVNYDANGGETKENRSTEKTYSVSRHSRPNTETGADLFTRSGYTLTSWNTKADGTGERIGLGSRVTVPEEGLTLYAVWEKQSDSSWFTFETVEGSAVITGFKAVEGVNGGEGFTDAKSAGACVVIPDSYNGLPVTKIAAGAFANADISSVVLPSSIKEVEDGAFAGASLEKVTLFDNIETVSDAAFEGCESLKTLYINAVEAPFGYLYRRESVYADKADLLINAQGKKKFVFYGGCSMWYNLVSSNVYYNFAKDYVPVNMGINGTVNGFVQMQIMEALLEDGDIFVHSPEFTSSAQMLTDNGMYNNDQTLWCGIENNYDLFTYVDMRTVTGVFDSLCSYLSIKDKEASYDMVYRDSDNNTYMDGMGGLTFQRTKKELSDTDKVDLDPESLEAYDLTELKAQYDRYAEKGVTVIISYACVNLDAVPEEHRENITATDMTFRKMMQDMGYPLISNLWDYIFREEDFYDTNYHLTTDAAERYTARFMRDLRVYLDQSGLEPMWNDPEWLGVEENATELPGAEKPSAEKFEAGNFDKEVNR